VPVDERPDTLVIAGREFRSRLFVGTGKYPSFQVMKEAHEASGTDVVTVAVRRVDLNARGPQNLLDHVDPKRYFLLPNTAACYTVDEAVRTARLGREAGLSNWVKLEVIGDEKTLFPDTEGLLAATRILVKEGFIVLPYSNDDLVVARRLEAFRSPAGKRRPGFHLPALPTAHCLRRISKGSTGCSRRRGLRARPGRRANSSRSSWARHRRPDPQPR